MVGKGRKPKPLAVKLVEGNPGKRALPKPRKKAPPPSPVGGRPKDAVAMPHGLTDAEKRFWRAVVAVAPHGVLQRPDEALILQYVRARRIYEEANEILMAGPLIRKYGESYRANPAIKIMNDQSDRMARILSELGFSPTARSRLGISDEEADAVDEDEDRFFN